MKEHSSGFKLEDFQLRTAKYVYAALRARSTPVYSIADQVGLGKTWIVADVLSRRLNARARIGKKSFVFYVAPSQGLLQQNMQRIHRYIQSATNADSRGRRVLYYRSRLSTLLLDSEIAIANDSERPGGCIHIVGLTSDVSFKLSGTGTLRERALLCAIFLGSARKPGYEQEFAKLVICPARSFFLLKRSTARFESWYQGVRQHLHHRENLIEQIRTKINFTAFEKEFADRNKNVDPKNAFVRIFRKHATLAAMKVTTITDIILDEWHRYSQLCIDPSWAMERKGRVSLGSTVLPDLLGEIRDGTRKGAAAILVSATPFVVRFEDHAGLEDLRNLSYIQFGKEKGDVLFQEILKLQTEFMHLTIRAAENEILGKSDWEEVKAARGRLQEKLLLLTVRTERPVTTVRDVCTDNHSPYVKHWDQSDLLIHVANPDVRSPVTALWADSRVFVEKTEYQSVRSHWTTLPKRRGGQLLKETHWKIIELQKAVDEMLSTSSPSKSPRKVNRYPPLWLRIDNSSDKSHCSKVLIFSEFTVTPHEISDVIRMGPIFRKGSRSVSGSIYGWFPDYLNDGRLSPAKAAHSWVHFFPLVTVEALGPESLLSLQAAYSKLFKKLPPREPVSIAPADKPELIQLLLGLDYYLLRSFPDLTDTRRNELEERMAQRASIFHYDFQEIKETSFLCLQEYIRSQPRLGSKDLLRPDSPGVVFAQSLARLRQCFAEKTVTQKQEQAVLKGAESLLRLFSSPEAQLICKNVYRLHKHRIKFARQYCRDNALYDVLKEYFELLAMGYCEAEDPVYDIMTEFHDVVTLGRGKTHKSRYVRPYADSKSELDGQEKKVATADLRAAFNSPFPPYLLVTTSIGQEGIDFHRYCRKIVHWSPPRCPSVLQQREGRLDRYDSLQVRAAVRSAKNRKIEIQTTGFSPHFTVLDKNGERLNSLDRTVLFLPFSSQEKCWDRCMERSYLTGILVGTPDPVSVELRFRALRERCPGAEDWQRVLQKVRESSICLQPECS